MADGSAGAALVEEARRLVEATSRSAAATTAEVEKHI